MFLISRDVLTLRFQKVTAAAEAAAKEATEKAEESATQLRRAKKATAEAQKQLKTLGDDNKVHLQGLLTLPFCCFLFVFLWFPLLRPFLYLSCLNVRTHRLLLLFFFITRSDRSGVYSNRC
jgi:lipopolysaccharide export LptBFGC system permease protein LptF